MMLISLFSKIVTFSLTAGLITLAVLLLRLCFKKAPRWILCAAWGLVALRLIIPVTVESQWSILPASGIVSTEEVSLTLPIDEPVPPTESSAGEASSVPATEPGKVVVYRAPAIHSGISAVDERVNNRLREEFAPEVETAWTDLPEADRLQTLLAIFSYIWLGGVAGMLSYAAISAFLMRRRLAEAVPYADDLRVRICDRVETPFLFGIFRPVIYLPTGLDPASAEAVIAHENCHIKRGDHLLKPFGFLLLCVYWFHLLLWVAYAMFCRDIEYACDEKVVKGYSLAERKEYATALLTCGMGEGVRRRYITVCPLAFGEVSVKERVKKVLHYKKPAFWIILLAAVALLVVGVLLLTAPSREEEPEPTSETSEVSESSESGEAVDPEKEFKIEKPGSYETVTVPAGTKALAPDAFKDCTVGNLLLPESLERVYSTSFEGATLKAITLGGQSYTLDEAHPSSIRKGTLIATLLAEHPEITLLYDGAAATPRIDGLVGADKSELCYLGKTTDDAYCYTYHCSYLVINGTAHSAKTADAQPIRLSDDSAVWDAARLNCRRSILSPGLDRYEYRNGFTYYSIDVQEYFGGRKAQKFVVVTPAGTPYTEFVGAVYATAKESFPEILSPILVRVHYGDSVREATYYGGEMPWQRSPLAPEGQYFVGWENVPGSNEPILNDEISWDALKDLPQPIDLYPVFAPQTVTVVFEHTNIERQTVSFGESLTPWKRGSGYADLVFAGWSLAENSLEVHFAADAKLWANGAVLRAMRDGVLHLWPVYLPADRPDYANLGTEMKELYVRFRNYTNALNGSVVEADTMGGEYCYDSAYYDQPYKVLSTAIFFDAMPVPLTKARMKQEAARIFDRSLLKTVNACPYRAEAVREKNGMLWEYIAGEGYGYPELWYFPATPPEHIWGIDENTMVMDVPVSYIQASMEATLWLVAKRTAEGWRIADCQLFRALYLDEGPDRITVEADGSTIRMRLGEAVSLLPKEMLRDGKPFAGWAIAGEKPLSERLLIGPLTYARYRDGVGEDDVLRLLPVYLTPDEWFAVYPKEQQVTVTDSDEALYRSGFAIKMETTRYPTCAIGSYDDAPRFIRFTGGGKVIEDHCINGYSDNYCIVIDEGVERIEATGLGPGARMLYLPRSLKDCGDRLFYSKLSPNALKNMIIYYAGSKAEFEKIRFDGKTDASFFSGAHIFYNVKY